MNGTHLIVDLLLAIAMVPAGLYYGRTLGQKGFRLAGAINLRSAKLLFALILVFVSSNLALPLSRGYPAISWYLPVPVEYYATPGLMLLNIGSLVFVSSAATALAFANTSTARWILPLVCISLFAVVEYKFRTSALLAAPTIGPEKLGDGGVVLQTGAATCGAAACASVMRLLGVHKTEREMVELLGTTEAGTSPAQMVYAMRKLGFDCVKRNIHDRDVSRVKAPAVLFVAVGYEIDGHAVALAKVQDGIAEIWDPRYGLTRYSIESLKQHWGGRAIEIAIE